MKRPAATSPLRASALSTEPTHAPAALVSVVAVHTSPQAEHHQAGSPRPRSFVREASQFRSTWLTSSLRALAARNLLDAYYEHLPKSFHDAVQTSVAGVWLPIDVAIHHYQACDALRLSVAEQVAIGREVTQFAHRTAYSMALRLATSAGVTPWACFSIQERLWRQVWVGGEVSSSRMGPKEAKLELRGWPCARIPYCRLAMRGLLAGQTELFCQKAYVNEISAECTPTSLAYRVAWA